MATLPEDWQSSRCLLESNQYMLDNQIECDLTFSLTDDNGEQVLAHAHRFILMSRSPVFFAMLTGPLAERTQEIRVTDISPIIFDQMLRYLYYEECDITEENAFVILYTAKKYLVTPLVQKCLSFLTSILSADNACNFLENAFLFEDDSPDLERCCMDLVKQHSRRVLHSAAFRQLSNKTLCKVLRAEKLSVHEIDVFRACVQWANRQCSEEEVEQTGANMRRFMGEAIRLIHFPTLSVNEFTQIVIPVGLLTTNEENCVFRYLLTNTNDMTKSVHAPGDKLPFPVTTRECVECKCVATYEGFLKHATTFTSLFHGMQQRSKWWFSVYTDHTIKLKEIAFFGKFKGTISVSQNNVRKTEISCDVHLGEIPLEGDGISLDAGLFTVASEAQFSYLGEYYSQSINNPIPGIVCDQDKVSVIGKDSSTLCFLSHIVFIPTDEMHFVEDYYSTGDMN